MADPYGWQHQKARKAAKAKMRDGDPCCRCGQPMYRGDDLHLDHDDYDRTVYLGLSHATCNERAGAVKVNAMRSGRWQAPQANPSRRW
jgi:hypothetical protein